MEDLTITDQQDKGIELLPEGVKDLNEARKWTMFLAILGFIATGFLVIAGLFMGTIFSFIPDTDLPGALGIILGIFYLVIAVVYFFPVLYLLQFSQKSKKAVEERDSNFLAEAIGRLKAHYKFIGIMTIVMMALYPVLVLIFVLVGVSSAF